MVSDSRSTGLDGIRGMAAVAVVIYHGINICDLTIPTRVINPELSMVPVADWPGRLALCIFDGSTAVNIFFILSGLVLSASLQREPVFDVWTTARFVLRRILRIYPALIVAVLAFGVASYISLPALFGAPFTPTQMLLNSFLVEIGVNGATWTLQVEMLMVPAILGVMWLQRIIGTMAPAAFFIVSLLWFFQGPPFGVAIMHVAMPAFALGLLIPTIITRDAVQRLPPSSWAAFLALAVALRFLSRGNDITRLLFILLLSYAVVAVVYHRPASGFLTAPAAQFFGRISYSLYLWHAGVMYELFPAYQVIFGAERLAAHYLLFGLAYGLLVVAIATPFALLTERWIERPFIMLGRHLSALRTRPAISLRA